LRGECIDRAKTAQGIDQALIALRSVSFERFTRRGPAADGILARLAHGGRSIRMTSAAVRRRALAAARPPKVSADDHGSGVDAHALLGSPPPSPHVRHGGTVSVLSIASPLAAVPATRPRPRL